MVGPSVISDMIGREQRVTIGNGQAVSPWVNLEMIGRKRCVIGNGRVVSLSVISDMIGREQRITIRNGWAVGPPVVPDMIGRKRCVTIGKGLLNASSHFCKKAFPSDRPSDLV